MNTNDTMVLVDGIDKTEKIKEFHHDPKRDTIKILYKNSETVYQYKKDRVQLFQNPSVLELNGRGAFANGMPVFEPECVLDFGEKIKIIGYKGRNQIVNREEFCLFENAAASTAAEEILSYLREISQYTSVQPQEEAFLKREMSRLTYVHPESVLSSYLNKSPIKKRKLDSEDIIFPFHFNLSQKKALENALDSSVSVIEGPPGTGKTQTILNIIANLIAVQGKSVAVVSNNNEAVKNVMEKMAKQEYGFLTAMLGKSDNQKAFFANMPEAAVDSWNCGEEVKELTGEIRKLNLKLNHLLIVDRRRAQIAQELLAWQLEQKHFEEYYARQDVEEIGKFPLFKANTDKILSFLAETSLAKDFQIDNNILFKLKLLFKYRVFNQKKLRYHEVSVLLRLQRAFYQKYIKNLESEITDLEHQLKGEHFEDLCEKHRQLSVKIFRKYIYQTYSNAEKPDYTKKDYKVRFSEFIKTFPVILSTTHALQMSIPQNFLLDYVIIDEASQVDLITGVLALSCCRNVIVVGDIKQLPQITDLKIQEKLSCSFSKTEYDYFNNSILTSVISLYGEQLPREILREHYRCHPSIIEFCNQKYYGGELIPYTSSEISDRPLLIYRTLEGNHMRHVTRGKEKGIYNQRELDVIVQEVLESPECVEDRENIGIVTPYRKQANKAAEAVADSVESDTVHKYQGREKDIMIMSTVLSGQKGQYNLKFVDDPQMVNVAVSRAIRQFVLVTDLDLFYKKGKDIGDLIRYIQYSTLDENVIESKVVSIFDLLYKCYSKNLCKYRERMKPDARYPSEEALRVLLEEILCEDEFERFAYVQEMLLRNLLSDTTLLNEEELNFVNNRASLDFVIFYKQDKSCVMVTEVDGFRFHENNPIQLQRDRIKDGILQKYGIPILRLPTNGSGEAEKIRSTLRACTV